MTIEYGSNSLASFFSCKKDGIDGANGYDSYYHSSLASSTVGEMTAYGVRAYWKPETSGAVPSVQVGYDTASFDEATAGQAEETEGWMIGLG